MLELWDKKFIDTKNVAQIFTFLEIHKINFAKKEMS